MYIIFLLKTIRKLLFKLFEYLGPHSIVGILILSFARNQIYSYENCEMAVAISPSCSDSDSVPGVAFKCLNQGQCSDWLEAFKCT